MNLTPARQTAVVLFIGLALSIFMYLPTYSVDLMAVWLAGSFLAAGQPDQVYPAVTEMFQMYPPDQWQPFMVREYQYEGPMFPFLYPPIWAKLAEPFANNNFWVFATVTLVVNCVLLMATVWLAYRATKTNMSPALFMGLAVFFLLATHIGTIALEVNQPQIFVSFLLVLTAERVSRNAPVAAGAALAIAAAIKIYPALFALLWLFGRQRRMFASFMVFGTMLGLISVIWAGWPLHKSFLELTQLISATVMVTGITINIDAMIAQLFFADHLIWWTALHEPTPVNPNPGWYSMVKPIAWRTTSAVAMLVAVTLLARAFYRADRASQVCVLWPLAIIVVVFFLPIAWVIYYIPVACFAPVLIEKLGTKLGTFFVLLPFGLILGPFIKIYRMATDWEHWPIHYPFQLVGVFAFTILAIGFALAARLAQKNANPGR